MTTTATDYSPVELAELRLMDAGSAYDVAQDRLMKAQALMRGAEEEYGDAERAYNRAVAALEIAS